MATNPLRFHGQYLDDLTGLYDMRARDYSTGAGRFTSTDPRPADPGTAFAQTYHYGYNQPTVLSDPSGACPWCAVGAVIGAAVGAYDCVANNRSARGCAASIGGNALAGGLTAATGGASLLGSAAARGGTMAVVGGAGYAATNAAANRLDGRRHTAGDVVRDFVYGVAGGAVGGAAGATIGRAAGAAFHNLGHATQASNAAASAARAAEAAAARRAADAAAFTARSNPGPRPADLTQIQCSPTRTAAAEGGSRLAETSSAAFRAADDPAAIFIKNKHLSAAGGNQARFTSDNVGEVQGWVAQGLRSDGVQFLPNGLDGTFRAIVPAGQVVGTRGQTFIRVIVSDDGRVINAFPVISR